MQIGESVKLILEGVQADMTVTDICELTGLSRSTVAVHLRNLVKAGYIDRRKRRCPYEVTKIGQEVID